MAAVLTEPAAAASLVAPGPRARLTAGSPCRVVRRGLPFEWWWHWGAPSAGSCQVYLSHSSFSVEEPCCCGPRRVPWCWVFPDATPLSEHDYRCFTKAFPHLQSTEEVQPEKSIPVIFPSALLRMAGIRCLLCKAEAWHSLRWDHVHGHPNSCISLAVLSG